MCPLSNPVISITLLTICSGEAVSGKSRIADAPFCHIGLDESLVTSWSIGSTATICGVDTAVRGSGALAQLVSSAAMIDKYIERIISLTKKAEPPPTRGVNRDSGTASANGGWLRRLVRQTASFHVHLSTNSQLGFQDTAKHPMRHARIGRPMKTSCACHI